MSAYTSVWVQDNASPEQLKIIENSIAMIDTYIHEYDYTVIDDILLSDELDDRNKLQQYMDNLGLVIKDILLKLGIEIDHDANLDLTVLSILRLIEEYDNPNELDTLLEEGDNPRTSVIGLISELSGLSFDTLDIYIWNLDIKLYQNIKQHLKSKILENDNRVEPVIPSALATFVDWLGEPTAGSVLYNERGMSPGLSMDVYYKEVSEDIGLLSDTDPEYHAKQALSLVYLSSGVTDAIKIASQFVHEYVVDASYLLDVIRKITTIHKNFIQASGNIENEKNTSPV